MNSSSPEVVGESVITCPVAEKKCFDKTRDGSKYAERNARFGIQLIVTNPRVSAIINLKGRQSASQIVAVVGSYVVVLV
jgi:hypothetical protein